MTEIRRIEAGNRMSEAVIYGDRLYTSGIVAEEAANKPVYEQTIDILKQIDQLLNLAGSNKTRILKANIWLSDMAMFEDMNNAWDAWVVTGQAPTRATVDAKLAAPEYAVEIMIEDVI